MLPSLLVAVNCLPHAARRISECGQLKAALKCWESMFLTWHVMESHSCKMELALSVVCVEGFMKSKSCPLIALLTWQNSLHWPVESRLNFIAIISAWNDGKIRAFKPQSGALLYTIHDAHKQGVTAISTTSDSKRIVSGGGEGQVRVWDISPQRQVMVAAMKEHKGENQPMATKVHTTEWSRPHRRLYYQLCIMEIKLNFTKI